jgi:hypothetical protein
MIDRISTLRNTFEDFIYKNPDITEAYLYCNESWKEIIEYVVKNSNTTKLSENRYQSLNDSIVNVIYDNNYNLELSGERR